MTNPTNANATLTGVANAESADMGGLHSESSTGQNAMCEVRRAIALVLAQNQPVTASQAVTFAELAQRCATPTIGPKDGPGWLPAVIAPGPRKGERVEAVTFLALDVEADAIHVKDEKGEPVRDRHGDIVKRVTGPEPPDVDAMLVELELTGWRCILHTSYSHGGSILPEGVDHPRYRLIFDLSRTLAPGEVQPLAHHVAGLLGLADCVDKQCMEPSRLFYAPRCPEERRALFRHAVTDGAALPVDAMLSEARKVEAAQHAAQTRRKGAKSASVIDPFNAAHDPGAILEAHGYAPKGRGRWLAPTSTTGMPGVRLLPDSTPPRIYSSHSGDPLADGRAHDAFDCWRILAQGGDTVRAVREAAAMLGMPRQPAQEAPPAPRADAVGQEAANDAAHAGVRRLFTLTRADHIQRKATDWLIRGYLVRDTLAALIAKPGACKSFLAVDWACRIATGVPWYGREVKPGTVFYFAGEGQRGLRKRIDGWEKHNGASLDGAPLFVASGMPFLCDQLNVRSTLAILNETAQELRATAAAPPALIVIDTVARAMNGANENATEDMGKFIAACDALRQEWRCTVLAVHHTGNDPGAQDRGRGNSNFGASMDSDFYLKVKGDDIELKAGDKAKDWRKPGTVMLSKVEIEVASIGDNGEPVTETTLALHDAAGAVVDTSMRDRVAELHRNGLTIREITDSTGVPSTTVHRWLKHAA